MERGAERGTALNRQRVARPFYAKPQPESLRVPPTPRYIQGDREGTKRRSNRFLIARKTKICGSKNGYIIQQYRSLTRYENPSASESESNSDTQQIDRRTQAFQAITPHAFSTLHHLRPFCSLPKSSSITYPTQTDARVNTTATKRSIF